MSSPSYSEKLRDPRWQRKRLEILQRDNFGCQRCWDTTTTLSVHHCYYEADREPWEYPDGSLLTLCENCHSKEESYPIRKQLSAEILGMLDATSSQLDVLKSAILSMGRERERDRDIIWAIAHCLENDDAMDIIKELHRKDMISRFGDPDEQSPVVEQ